MNNVFKYLLIQIFVLFTFSSALWASEVSLRPQWAPQAQFAGFYIAAQKGFYRDNGIELLIKDGGPGIKPLDELATGETTFGTSWLLSAVKKHDEGVEIVNICQLIQRSALVLIAKKSSRIKTIDDLNGKKIGLWPGDFQLPPETLFRLKDLHVQKIQQGFTLEPFINDEIDVCSAMLYNEYLILLENGNQWEDLIVFSFDELGMNFPEDGIYVGKEFLNKNPDLCRSFVNATIKGWSYAFTHVDETAAIMTQLANQTGFKTTLEHQKGMLLQMKELITYRVGMEGIGELSKKDFDFVCQVLEWSNQKSKPIVYDDFFVPQTK